MSTEKKADLQQGAALPSEVENNAGVADASAPKLSLRENVIVTIKVLAGFGLLGTALWAIELWVST